MVALAKNNEKIVAITASMKDGTGLTEFAKQFPKRFFDIGIAEQHAIGVAAGMAKGGVIPVVPIYSSFYQRAYDQVIHDVAMQNLPVIMCVDRAGIVGADGETHQGTLDMSFFRLVPNLTIMAPKDFKELENMLEFAINLNKPVIIRYPRGGEDEYKMEKQEKLEQGKAEILKEGKDLTIIAIGKTVARAMKIAEEIEEITENKNMLKIEKEQLNKQIQSKTLKEENEMKKSQEKKNKTVEVINVRFLKPIDKETIKQSLQKTKNVITIEDGTIINGLATAIQEIIIQENLQDIHVKNYAYPDKYIEHGTVEELEKRYGLDAKTILEQNLENP